VKAKKEFIGRVFWRDPTASYDYQHTKFKKATDRMGKFVAYGLVNLEDEEAIIVKEDIELLDFDNGIETGIRGATDIPRGKNIIFRVEEYLGKGKWKIVKT